MKVCILSTISSVSLSLILLSILLNHSTIPTSAYGGMLSEPVPKGLYSPLSSQPLRDPLLLWSVVGNQEFAAFSISVDSAGDINGDGYDDVLVGAGFYQDGNDVVGRAYVYHGSETGLSNQPDLILEGNESNAFYRLFTVEAIIFGG